MILRHIDQPERLDRKVLFAVELLDPVTQSLVYRGLRVKAQGIIGQPIISASNRFVWLREGKAWPGLITVTPERVPYQPHVQAAPRAPVNPDEPSAAEQLVRITLRPTAAYPFDAGLTALRGWLRETRDVNSARIEGALVQLAWREKEDGPWHPLPPANIGEPGDPSPREGQTNKQGEFATFVRLIPVDHREPDVDDGGFLKVRIQVTRRVAGTVVTRKTSDDFEFLPPDQAPAGRVPLGRLLPQDVALAWSGLETL